MTKKTQQHGCGYGVYENYTHRIRYRVAKLSLAISSNLPEVEIARAPTNIQQILSLSWADQVCCRLQSKTHNVEKQPLGRLAGDVLCLL
jgi:hypothetical protein